MKTGKREREKEKKTTNFVWLYFDLCVSLCPLGYRVHVNAGDEGTSLLHLFKWKVLRLIQKIPISHLNFFLGNPDQKVLVVRCRLWLFWRNAHD